MVRHERKRWRGDPLMQIVVLSLAVAMTALWFFDTIAIIRAFRRWTGV